MTRSSLFASCAALLLAASCSPEAEAPARNEAEAGPAMSQAAAPEPKAETPAPKAAASAPTPAPAAARRCGWLENPTPGNWWLVDRDGEWVLGMQGGYQARGLDEMPDMSEGEWRAVNGSYGYGCACMDIVADPSRRVLKVASAKSRPLAVCRADKRLHEPTAD